MGNSTLADVLGCALEVEDGNITTGEKSLISIVRSSCFDSSVAAELVKAEHYRREAVRFKAEMQFAMKLQNEALQLANKNFSEEIKND